MFAEVIRRMSELSVRLFLTGRPFKSIKMCLTWDRGQGTLGNGGSAGPAREGAGHLSTEERHGCEDER